MRKERDTVSETIGQRVARLRKAHGWMQAELAERAGTSGTYIGHIESGRRVPGTDLCVKLADTFDITLDELIRGTSPNAPRAASTGLINTEVAALAS
jgi:transcriptional regulator with XRE-family HTH domain